jgi:hypothetical protein
VNAHISDKLNKRNRPDGYYEKLKNRPPIETELSVEEFDFLKSKFIDKMVIWFNGTAKARILH